MCGITGIIGEFGIQDVLTVQKMCNIIDYRGPNAGGVIALPGATLGHRRLSIIDPVDNSNQPMFDNSKKISIVFNGEIYNYLEIKKEIGSSYNFKTKSDTEVLLAAYSKWGANMMEKLVGMFSFCIFDIKNQLALLARDRFGQKPLFFSLQKDSLIFSSEIKAILSAGLQPTPNLKVIGRYLKEASYDDDDETFFSGINQILPGEYAIYSKNNLLSKKKYYSLENQIFEYNGDFISASQKVRKSMLESINLHMRSDVPVGISLSGGLDSSVLLSCIKNTGNLTDSTKCFSVEFGDEFSEAKWINKSASFHKINNYIHSFTKENFIDSIYPSMWHLEAPIGGLMNCALTIVNKAARELNIPVLQDGTGIDEAFGGYRNHQNIYLANLIKSKHPSAYTELEKYAQHWNIKKNEAHKIINEQLNKEVTAIDGTNPIYPGLLNSQILNLDTKSNTNQSFFNDDVRGQLIDYLTNRKIPRNMRMKDRISMAYGIELRQPFLEHKLIELAMSLPVEYFFHNGQTKSVVREAFAPYMDREVAFANKRNIQAPQGKWLKDDIMRSYIGDMVNSKNFSELGIFNIAKVKNAFDNFCNKKHENSFFVWQWINIDAWFKTFIHNSATKFPQHLMKNRKHIKDTRIIDYNSI